MNMIYNFFKIKTKIKCFHIYVRIFLIKSCHNYSLKSRACDKFSSRLFFTLLHIWDPYLIAPSVQIHDQILGLWITIPDFAFVAMRIPCHFFWHIAVLLVLGQKLIVLLRNGLSRLCFQWFTKDNRIPVTKIYTRLVLTEVTIITRERIQLAASESHMSHVTPSSLVTRTLGSGKNCITQKSC